MSSVIFTVMFPVAREIRGVTSWCKKMMRGVMSSVMFFQEFSSERKQLLQISRQLKSILIVEPPFSVEYIRAFGQPGDPGNSF